MRRLLVVGIVVAFAAVGWTQVAGAPLSAPVCGSGAQASLCFGAFDVPTKQVGAFASAGTTAIDAIHSRAFRDDLAAFIARHSATGDHAAAWRGVDADAVVKALQARVPGQTVTTYGGLRGWWVNLIYGNVAYDGAEGGPIRFNRAALPRPVPSLANTLAHELSHRAGLRHPHSDGDLPIAKCEPPYVIGTLVEKHAAGQGWTLPEDDCQLIGK